MSLRAVLVGLMVLGAGSLVWLSTQSHGNSCVAAVVKPSATVKVLVSTQPLQAGTLLKDADFREQDEPVGSISGGAFLANDNDRAEIRGAMVRKYFEAGHIILRPEILRPRDRGFLAAVLAPGTRAVSIGVDATTGASGLISPGDMVDVLLTQQFSRDDAPAGRRVVAETVLSAVRVIAVDQQIAQGPPTSSLMQGAPSNRVANTISLEVTPEQAAKVVVAERLGRLTLIVRSIDVDQLGRAGAGPAVAGDGNHGSSKPEALPVSVFGSDVSAALSHDEPAASPKLRLIQGNAASEVIFR